LRLLLVYCGIGTCWYRLAPWSRIFGVDGEVGAKHVRFVYLVSGDSLLALALLAAVRWRDTRYRGLGLHVARSLLILGVYVCCLTIVGEATGVPTIADGLTAWCGIAPDPHLCSEFQRENADMLYAI